MAEYWDLDAVTGLKRQYGYVKLDDVQEGASWVCFHFEQGRKMAIDEKGLTFSSDKLDHQPRAGDRVVLWIGNDTSRPVVARWSFKSEYDVVKAQIDVHPG
ncbi:MAG: hypothetical protein ABH846_02055 [Patescibacteria group bacterium]